jgi:glycosyltransferase involved in cell wall biosynthesis
MRVGLVTACYKPVVNGVTRMVELYRRYLEAAGHEITIFTWGRPPGGLREPGVMRSPAMPLGTTGYYFGLRFNRAARQRLRQMDVVHAHHLLMALELAHRDAAGPVVYTNHTRLDLYAAEYLRLPPSAARWLMRRVWPAATRHAQAIIAPSPSIAQTLRAFGVSRPIALIPNGVELDRFRQTDRIAMRRRLGYHDEIVAIYTGRLAAEKNVLALLDSFARFRAGRPDVRLLLVGGGPLQAPLARRAAALGIGSDVAFSGPVAPEDVPGYLAAADFFVTASLTETHPLSVIEALAAGLPVAAFDAPGVADIVVHDQTGFLVSPESKLEDALNALGSQPSRREHMSRAAALAGAAYDIRATVERTVALYNRLLAGVPLAAADGDVAAAVEAG